MAVTGPAAASNVAVLAVSSDGNTLIAGAPQDNAPSAGGWGIGAAWIFVRNSLQFTTPASAVAGVPVTIGISAVGPNHVVSAGYFGSVSLSSSDSQAVLPQNTVLSNGAGTFAATFNTPGPQTITANYGPAPLVTGTSNAIQVRAPAIQISPPSLTLQYTPGSDLSTIIPGNVAVSRRGPHLVHRVCGRIPGLRCRPPQVRLPLR